MKPYDIQKLFKGRNFMTPELIKFGYVEQPKQSNVPLVYELSKGEGFSREIIYGLTVKDLSGKTINDLSGCYHSMILIENLIKSL